MIDRKWCAVEHNAYTAKYRPMATVEVDDKRRRRRAGKKQKNTI